MRRPKPHPGWAIPILTAVAGLVLFLADPLVLRSLRNNVFDQYQRLSAPAWQAGDVRIVDIDEASLTRLGQWPWPRLRLAELVNAIRDAGARTIVFDIVFAEPDRTSPQAMMATWQTPPGLRQALARLPDHDRVFADAIAPGRVVLGHAPEERAGKIALAEPYSVVDMGPPSWPFLHPFGSTVPALPVLQQAGAGNGAMSFLPDQDGIVRRVPLFVGLGGKAVPSLVSEALRVSQDAREYAVMASDTAGAGLEEVLVGERSIPTTAEGEMWVRYTRAGAGRYLPAWKVLAGGIPRAELEGKIVLVGTSAKGLLDLRFSPFGRAMPGVEVHAMALEQILAGDFLARPNWARGLEVSLLVAGSLLVGFLALSAGALVSAGALLAVLAVLTWGAWEAFRHYGLLIDPVSPGLAIGLSFTLASVHHHLSSERRQRWVRQAFSRYVSPNLVRHLVDDPGALELGGQRRLCTFIFTDLAGFTSLMEKLDPGEAVGLLNVYLDNMIRVAFEHEGTLDRIVGDAVAIMFSAPLEQPDHQARAVRCAEAMHRFASQFSADTQARGIPFGVTRIGVHTGEVTVGNFGGSTIFDYRALGDPVNTSSRLESVNKQLGTLVCISADTLKGAPDTPARPVGKLVLKGKTEPLMVYQPLFSVTPETTAPLAEYGDAYALMQAEDPATLDRFAALARRWPQDGLVGFHCKRLSAGQVGERIVFTEK